MARNLPHTEMEPAYYHEPSIPVAQVTREGEEVKLTRNGSRAFAGAYLYSQQYVFELESELRTSRASHAKAWSEVERLRSLVTNQEHDVSRTTQALIDLLIQRDRAGRAKYGTTLDRVDLAREDWLQHMAEELLDGAGYALAAKRVTSS